MLYFKKNTGWLNFGFNFAIIYFVVLIFMSLSVRVVFDYVLDLNLSPSGGFTYNDEKQLVPVKSYYDLYIYSKTIANILGAILLGYWLYKRRTRMITYNKQVEELLNQNQKDNNDA